MKKDKQRIEDEVWTPERVRSFLDLQPPQGWNRDAWVLLRAYRSMRLNDFELFLDYFSVAAGDPNAADPAGRTLMDIVRGHRNSRGYAEALARIGGQHS